MTGETGIAFNVLFKVGGEYTPAEFSFDLGSNATLDATANCIGAATCTTSGTLSAGEIFVPEPATMLLLGTGLLGLGASIRRKMK